MADLPYDQDAFEYQDGAFETIPPKPIDLRNPDIAFEPQRPEAVEVLKPMQVQSPMANEAFIEGLDQMNRDLDEAMEESKKHHRLVMETITGITLSISARFVSWLLKTGSLMASFMSTMPIWKQFDPLPILGAAMAKNVKGTKSCAK